MPKMQNRKVRLIEADEFPFEFLSRLAERESWRKEVHRPIYHVHKWWAKRLGTVFRGILLGSTLPVNADLEIEFYRRHDLTGLSVFDPFMGSGTTIGEAHKLGLIALGRDINPVAVSAVTTALGPLNRRQLLSALEDLQTTVGQEISSLFRSTDSLGRPCDVLYHFWVMQARCPDCCNSVDLFSSYVIARNAYPNRKPEVQVLCPKCGDIFPALNSDQRTACRSCEHAFEIDSGPASGITATCECCSKRFKILGAIRRNGDRPTFRHYGKLVLRIDGTKEYLPATDEDRAAYATCSDRLQNAEREGTLRLPDLQLEPGHNTKQAMGYGFVNWRQFFNDRQLLSLGLLFAAIQNLPDSAVRAAMTTLFSGVLEFNNLFASYKGEGTGAVRHMFSHHILKPERMPIEAHPWGTPKSSGSFSNLFRGRLLRAIDYRQSPTELRGKSGPAQECSSAFSGEVSLDWPSDQSLSDRAIYLSCGDSAVTGLPDESIDLVVTDPPFFDNVHYSELADFFYAWQRLTTDSPWTRESTRHANEVQDSDSQRFADKLRAVFVECHRVLKEDGLLVFTYHHSRDEGWQSLAAAILGAGFVVTNSQPVKGEMSVATPKAQAKEPIQLDIVLVCRKQTSALASQPSTDDAFVSARDKLRRLRAAGFHLSRNDCKIVFFGQLLTAIREPGELASLSTSFVLDVDNSQDAIPTTKRAAQRLLFE